MPPVLPVMAGGAVGAALRFAASRALPISAGGWPWATLAVNLAGALAMGVLIGWAERHALGEPVRLFLAPGLLGGFTTFSAFSLETVALIEAGRPTLAAGYVLASVLGGVTLLVAGLAVGRAA